MSSPSELKSSRPTGYSRAFTPETRSSTVGRLPGSAQVERYPRGLFRRIDTGGSGEPSLRPSTRMVSVPMRARLPSWVTTRPLTVTLPSRIHTSTWRREANPAAAMIFCNLSPSAGWTGSFFLVMGPSISLRRCVQGFDNSVLIPATRIPGICRQWLRADFGTAGEHSFLHLVACSCRGILGRLSRRDSRKILQAGEICQTVQPEVDEEFFRRAVKNGLSHHLFPSQGPNEPTLQEGLQHTHRVGPSEGLDLGSRHRLPVGDDGQSLKGGPGEPDPIALAIQRPDPGVVLRPGLHAVAARHLDDADAARQCGILEYQLIQRAAHRGLFLLRKGGEDFLLFQGLLGYVDQGLQHRLDIFGGQLGLRHRGPSPSRCESGPDPPAGGVRSHRTVLSAGPPLLEAEPARAGRERSR